MRDVKERKCGCVIFAVGPPILCEKHQSKADQKQARLLAREEKGLRKIVLEQAEAEGHELSRFKEYPSRPGKWTAHCHRCGAIVIVYDLPPEFGDQIAGGVFETCQPGGITSALNAIDREAAAARFKGDEDEAEDP